MRNKHKKMEDSLRDAPRTIRLHIKEARLIIEESRLRRVEAFIWIRYANQQWESEKSKRRGKNPYWDVVHSFTHTGQNTLEVLVKDTAFIFGSREIGRCVLNLKDLPDKQQSFTLIASNSQIVGAIQMAVSLEAFSVTVSTKSSISSSEHVENELGDIKDAFLTESSVLSQQEHKIYAIFRKNKERLLKIDRQKAQLNEINQRLNNKQELVELEKKICEEKMLSLEVLRKEIETEKALLQQEAVKCKKKKLVLSIREKLVGKMRIKINQNNKLYDSDYKGDLKLVHKETDCYFN